MDSHAAQAGWWQESPTAGVQTSTCMVCGEQVVRSLVSRATTAQDAKWSEARHR